MSQRISTPGGNTHQFILGIDQGTTSTTVMVFDRDAHVLGRGYSTIKQIYPKPGWVEHDPRDIWQGTVAAVRQAMGAAGIRYTQIAAIGITNQRETVVVWDKTTGQPVANAIVWQDRRTTPMCERMRAEGLEAELRSKTGLMIDPYFSGTKIAWLLENVPGLRERANRGEVLAGTIDSWLIWNLTGRTTHITDYSNASRTLLYNIYKKEWDDEITSYFNIPQTILPRVMPSSFRYGTTQPGIFDTGTPAIPITSAIGDQQAALFGQTCFQPGTMKTTYGTGAFLLINTGITPIQSQNGLITTIAWGYNGEVEYALEGSTFIAGAVVQWLRDELGLISDAAQTSQMAQSVKDNGGVYIVPAFVGLGAPYWDARARGSIFGLTRGANKNHLVRASLESIAYQIRDVTEAMLQDSGLAIDTMKVDGGAVANDFLMQFQADILGIQVERPGVIETTALGAVYLAGLSVGYWTSQDDLLSIAGIERTFTPAMSETKRERYYATWKKAVSRAIEWEEADGSEEEDSPDQPFTPVAQEDGSDDFGALRPFTPDDR